MGTELVHANIYSSASRCVRHLAARATTTAGGGAVDMCARAGRAQSFNALVRYSKAVENRLQIRVNG
jgi:hypothetical protein